MPQHLCSMLFKGTDLLSWDAEVADVTCPLYLFINSSHENPLVSKILVAYVSYYVALLPVLYCGIVVTF